MNQVLYHYQRRRPPSGSGSRSTEQTASTCGAARPSSTTFLCWPSTRCQCSRTLSLRLWRRHWHRRQHRHSQRKQRLSWTAPRTLASCGHPSVTLRLHHSKAPAAERHHQRHSRTDRGSISPARSCRRKRTAFFAAGEWNREAKDSPVTSPLAPGIFVGHYRGWLGLLRLDHEFNDRNNAFLRVNFDNFTDTNPNGIVGGASLPTVARTFHRRTYSGELGETRRPQSASRQ